MIDLRHILLGRKCIREERVVGDYVKNSMGHRLYNVTAYDLFLSDTFSLQENIYYLDICHPPLYQVVLFQVVYYNIIKHNETLDFILYMHAI